MNQNRDNLIAGLTEELSAVRVFRKRDGIALLAVSALATLVGVELSEGLWRGILTGEPAPFFWVTSGLLLGLGLAASGVVIAMASPSVGQRHDAPRWASAMLGVLPLAALVSALSGPEGVTALTLDDHASHCLQASLVASLASGAALVLWLRRGAPVSLEKAGWLAGIAAGSLGTLAYGISCTVDSVTHLGIWHVAPVALTAFVGRLVVPPLVRW
ncbi:MAG: NrsF family protein [Erythrobacter sp.]